MTVSNSTSGGSSRRIIVLSAVLVVAMFMAVPLTVTFDSDADYGTGEAGFSVDTSNKASEAELAAIDRTVSDILGPVASTIASTAGFNVDDLDIETATGESFTFKAAYGQKVDSASKTTIESDEASVKKLSVTFIASSADPMFMEIMQTPKQAELITAMKAFFGTDTFAIGDKITVTADSADYIETQKSVINYGEKSDTECLPTSTVTSYAMKLDAKATIAFTRGGDTKSITVEISGDSVGDSTVTYVYGKDLKDVTDYQAITLNMKSVPKSLSIDFKATIGDNDYKVDDYKSEETENSIPGVAFIYNKSDIKVDPTLKNFCDTAKSSDNVTIEVGYDKAESAYDSAVDDVSPSKKKAPIALIIVGVVAAVVVIGAVAFFVVKKKA